MSATYPASITQILQGLVGKQLLVQHGKKRGATYQLGEIFWTAENNETDSTQTDANSTQKEPTTPHIGEDNSAQSDFSPEIWAVAEPARKSRKLPTARMRQLIIDLCSKQYLTPRELGTLLDRQPIGLQQNYLRGMVQDGELVLRYPDEPNHPQQAYGTKSTEHEP